VWAPRAENSRGHKYPKSSIFRSDLGKVMRGSCRCVTGCDRSLNTFHTSPKRSYASLILRYLAFQGISSTIQPPDKNLGDIERERNRARSSHHKKTRTLSSPSEPHLQLHQPRPLVTFMDPSRLESGDISLVYICQCKLSQLKRSMTSPTLERVNSNSSCNVLVLVLLKG
jgi:hypothetical protein